MKLTALRLHNIRRFADRGIAIEGMSDGVNVLCAANEYGKSTCFDALHALFSQAHTGTPSAVRALQPYSGGSPLIEADIVTANGPVRLTKQFYSGRRAIVRDLASSRVIAQADEAERYIAGLVRGGTGGPAGLLWVRQGDTGLEKRGKSEEDERRARQNVLSSVQGELETLTGGRRMEEIVAACEEELSKFVTATLRPKAGGPYARAIEERDRLVEAETKLARDVEDLRVALDERRRVRARLAEIENPEESASRRAAADEAEKALAEARTRNEALKTAKAEASLARTEHDAAKAKLDAWRLSAARMQELQTIRAAAVQRRDEALARQREALSADNAAAGHAGAAEREEQEARALLARLDRALRARDAAMRLAELREALAKAEAARLEIEEGEALLRVLDVPEKPLRKIEELEAEIAGLKLAATMNAPRVRVKYRDGAAGAVTLDGVALEGGQEIGFIEPIRLDISGIGSLALTPGRSDDGDDRLTTAESERRSLLQKLGVESLHAARQRQADAREKRSAIELARQRLALCAPNGVNVLREDIARLEGVSAGELELKGDPEEARKLHQAAEQRIADTRNAVHATRVARDQADRLVVDVERKLALIEGEYQAVETALGPAPERAARERNLQRAFSEAAETLVAAHARVETLARAVEDLANAEAAYRRTQSALKAVGDEAAKLRERLAGLDGRIRTRADDAVEEAWRETTEARIAAETRVARFEKDVAVMAKLRNVLGAARADARDHYFEPVVQELRPLMGLLFDDASVAFDDETLLPLSVRRNGLDEPVTVLSGGMREQLAILTRLAFAKLLARGGNPAPVILDDALVYSDDDRIERMFDALHRQSRDQQIIVFSCRQRAFSKLGGNVLEMAPWKPES